MRGFCGVALFFVVQFLWAQQTVSISGKVSNASGQGIAGAIVKLAAGGNTATTDANGNYALTGQTNSISKSMGQIPDISHVQLNQGVLSIYANLPIAAQVAMHNIQGASITKVFNGNLNAGENRIAIKTLAKGMQLLSITTLNRKIIYKVMAGGSYVLQSDNSMLSESQQKALAKTMAIDWLQVVKTGYASHSQTIDAYTGTVNVTLGAITSPDFGNNVKIYDPTTPTATIQTQVTAIFTEQERAQFGTGRYAILFKPGQYSGIDVNVGYYTHVAGLGLNPDDVSITGSVHAEADWFGGNATHNFWRAAENMMVTPTGGTMRWAVSQACPFRRMHVKGSMVLDDGGWSSGGFLANSKIDGSVNSGSQQQWFSRNTDWTSWSGAVWNMFFLGVSKPPTGVWPTRPYTTVEKTPIVREKPYLYIDNTGSYFVRVPSLLRDQKGISWATGSDQGESIPLDLFYIAKPADNAATINAALAQGKNLLLTPGIYTLTAPIQITKPNTILLGLGLPSLIPSATAPTTVLKIADVPGVVVAGITFDAQGTLNNTLMEVGPAGSSANHSANPTSLHDIFCRVGGQFSGSATSCLTINSNNVIGDHFWLWRADHGTGVGWGANKSANGLIVNGNNVHMYGLFNEHFQEYNNVWNGNGGKTFFFQNELPYDAPGTGWGHGTVKGWAAYKVGDNVTSHEAWGLGVYSAFRNGGICDNAIETPALNGKPDLVFRRLVAVFLDGGGQIGSVINGKGGAATTGTRQVYVDNASTLFP